MKKIISTVITIDETEENLTVENTIAILKYKRYDLFSGRIDYLEYFLTKNNIKYKKKRYDNKHCLKFSYKFTFKNKNMNFIFQWEKDKA